LKEFLDQVQQHQIDSLPYCQTGLIDIQKWVGIQGQDKLFNSTFVFENLPDQDTKLQSRFEVLRDADSTIANFNSYDMTLAVNPTADSLEYSLDFDVTKIDRMLASRIASHFNYITTKITHFINDNNIKVSMNSLMTLNEKELQTLVEFGTGPKADIRYECAHHAFEEIARNEPHLIAVEHEDRSITYGELNERAEEIACLLMNRGVKVGDYVGLVTTRSIEMVCGIFGILKAGGAYIPIDHELPIERIQYMLELADCSTILYHPDIREELLQILEISECISLTEVAEDVPFIAPFIPKSSPVYVIFTSGSTGKPKGIVIKHSSLSNYCNQEPDLMFTCRGDRIGQNASIGFDVSVAEIFESLSKCATLVLRVQSDYYTALKSINKSRFTPTALSKLHPSDCPNLIAIFSGGETFIPSLIEKWGHCQIFNCYGPSEIGITSSFARLVPGKEVSVGKPMVNTIQYIVNKELKLVPIGVPGELVIGGAGVALGYLNRPDLTAEKFIDNHFLND
ncbi:hypothetical protein HDV02_006761, partial [Globomyces sp. JEL0801]